MADPTQISTAHLEDGDTGVKILSLGCITQDWRVPCGDVRVPVVLGYTRAEDYRHNPNFLGVVAGRVANRIADARFSLEGQVHQLDCNEGRHHLHGGRNGIGTRNWQMNRDGSKSVQLSLTSDDGDMGYPGRAQFEVTITLTGQSLTYVMRTTTDRPTPINLAQHSYYNLMGGGTIGNHRLQVDADRFTPVGPGKIPTGEVLPLDGLPFDFRDSKLLSDAYPECDGLDANLVLTWPGERSAQLTAPNGLTLTLTSDQPGLQVYTGQYLLSGATPLPGQTHGPFAGICLEPQHFPNTPNQPQFPSILVTPDHPYRQTLTVEIGQEER